MEQGNDVRPRVDLGWEKMTVVLDRAMPVRRDRRWLFILLLVGLMLAILLLTQLVGGKTKAQNGDAQKQAFAEVVERGMDEAYDQKKDEGVASIGIFQAEDDERNNRDIRVQKNPLSLSSSTPNEVIHSNSSEGKTSERVSDESVFSITNEATEKVEIPVFTGISDPRQSHPIENSQPGPDNHVTHSTGQSSPVEKQRIPSLASLPVVIHDVVLISKQALLLRSVPKVSQMVEPLADKQNMEYVIDAGVDVAYFHHLSFPGISSSLHLALQPTRRFYFGPVIGVGAAKKVDTGQSGADDLAASSPDAGVANVDLSNEFSARYFESFYFLEAGLRASVMPAKKLSVSAGAGYMYIFSPGFNTNSGRSAFEVLAQDAENTSGASFEFPEITYGLDRQWLPYGAVDIEYRISKVVGLSAGYRVMLADVFEGTEDALRFDRVRFGMNVTIE